MQSPTNHIYQVKSSRDRTQDHREQTHAASQIDGKYFSKSRLHVSKRGLTCGIPFDAYLSVEGLWMEVSQKIRLIKFIIALALKF